MYLCSEDTAWGEFPEKQHDTAGCVKQRHCICIIRFHVLLLYHFHYIESTVLMDDNYRLWQCR